MSAMFWVWLAVIVATVVVELITMELVSVWFTIGAIVPFILAATNAVGWEIQVVIFVVVSAVLVLALRKITKKFLLRNSNEKTNLEAIIGKEYRMLTETDFDTIGTLKINDIVWNAVGKNQQEIKKGEIVRVLKVDGNKLIVEKVEPKKNKGE